MALMVVAAQKEAVEERGVELEVEEAGKLALWLDALAMVVVEREKGVVERAEVVERGMEVVERVAGEEARARAEALRVRVVEVRE